MPLTDPKQCFYTKPLNPGSDRALTRAIGSFPKWSERAMYDAEGGFKSISVRDNNTLEAEQPIIVHVEPDDEVKEAVGRVHDRRDPSVHRHPAEPNRTAALAHDRRERRLRDEDRPTTPP